MSEPPADPIHSRPPFPYENASALLRQLMVPDPVSAEVFDRSCSARYADSGPCMASRLLLGAALTPQQYLQAVAGPLHLPVCPSPRFLPPETDDPAASALRHLGFLPLDPRCVSSTGETRPVCGGPHLPANLAAAIGSEHHRWQWYLVPPPDITNSQPLPETPSLPPPTTDHSRTDPAQWLSQLLHSLLARCARDIHFETTPGSLTIRAFVDDQLQTIATWSDSLLPDTTLRLLRQWAGFSIADNAPPQDGRLFLPQPARTSFRAAWLPTHNGQSMVLRVPPPTTAPPPLPRLGFPAELADRLASSATTSPGLFLFTGPTGSGKTTSACSLLHQITGPTHKLLTIEDPVEHRIPHAVQCEVDSARDWNFATAVRAFLRQDPDFLLVGELRDPPAAESAVRAALTGHTVVSTLHAASTTAARDRLKAWGISNALLQETVRAIIHQRLHKGRLASTQAEFPDFDPPFPAP